MPISSKAILTIVAAGVFLTAFSQPIVVAQQAALELDLEGEITARCEIIGLDAGNSVDLSRGDEDKVGFEVDCNVPMRLELFSKNGGLFNERVPEGAKGRGFVRSIPYQATVTIPAINMDVTASSQEMSSGAIFDSGNEIPFRTSGSLALRKQDVDVSRRFAGRYVDVIKINAFPALGAGGV